MDNEIIIKGKVSKEVFAEANATLLKKNRKKTSYLFLGIGILTLLYFNYILITQNSLQLIHYYFLFLAIFFISYPLFFQKWYYKWYYKSYYKKVDLVQSSNTLTITNEKTTLQGEFFHIDFNTNEFNQLINYKTYLLLSKEYKMDKTIIIEKGNLQENDIEKLKQFATKHQLETNF